ncbi:type II toxin-antitoxin system VapB family antitoxin [Mesorhizobium sp. RP14(2022)]|uniref:Type II toxin-antitoxin system VapB family antitoxin n=1 Tax=Mesorhizobium liriopis TaxID=2953882 RepID=A0ABT1C212_9HYPH|nr:type II toxin-antitoxin system VapB family antitoxin [Mesorhizobium liriopis]MCO6048850.1 type II toxin-antitoxin system VapB family antitoxin [Mesorhizobium liriopis]
MRTNIELDDALIGEVMKISGQKTKRGAIDQLMREYIQAARRREAIEGMRGMGWDGDLDAMRESWSVDLDRQ